MPGYNNTGLPRSEDIVLGRGSLHFAELDATTGKPKGFRHLGNCTAFNITMDVETLEHENSRSGVRSVDREIILKQKVGVSITLDENSHQNLALWVSGEATNDNTNPARTTQTNRAINGTNGAFKTFSYELTDATGKRLVDINPANLSVRTDVGGTPTPLAQGTDYTVDAKWGIIFLTLTGAHNDGDLIDYTYTTTGSEAPVDEVNILSKASVSGFLRFIEINAANNDAQQVMDLHSVTLKADGEMQRIGDEFSAMTLTGTAERNETGFPDAPVGKFYTHADT